MTDRHRVRYTTAHGWFYGDQAGSVPVPKDMPGVKGIFLGGCVQLGIGSKVYKNSVSTMAHAHPGGSYKDWICFQVPEYFTDRKEYDWLRWHEYAHVTTGEGHTDAWRAEMVRLGQPIPPNYQRRRRAPKKTS